MKTITIAALVATVAGLSATTGAFAREDRPCGNVPVGQWMNEAQLRERIAPLNLQVEEIDVEDGCYEVEVRNADGRDFDILFHPQTGEQVRVGG